MEPEVATPEEELDTENEEVDSQASGPSSTVSAGTTYGERDPETKKKPRIQASITIYPGADLTEAVEMYGEEVVFEDYRRSVERRASNAIRTSLNKHLDNGADPAQIPDLVQAELADWRPDSDRRPTRRSPEENILSNFNNLPAEKQAEILARLQAQASGQG